MKVTIAILMAAVCTGSTAVAAFTGTTVPKQQPQLSSSSLTQLHMTVEEETKMSHSKRKLALKVSQ